MEVGKPALWCGLKASLSGVPKATATLLNSLRFKVAVATTNNLV